MTNALFAPDHVDQVVDPHSEQSREGDMAWLVGGGWREGWERWVGVHRSHDGAGEIASEAVEELRLVLVGDHLLEETMRMWGAPGEWEVVEPGRSRLAASISR